MVKYPRALVVTVASFRHERSFDEYSITARVFPVARRTMPHSDTFPPERFAASGSRKPASAGFALPSDVRRPDSKPPYLPLGAFGRSSRSRYCENATTRGL